MSYINKKQKVFLDRRPKKPCRKRSEGRMKEYQSETDLRSWCDEIEDRRQHILELILRGSDCKEKTIPIDTLIDSLTTSKNSEICKEIKKYLQKLWDFLDGLAISGGDREVIKSMQQEIDGICKNKDKDKTAGEAEPSKDMDKKQRSTKRGKGKHEDDKATHQRKPSEGPTKSDGLKDGKKADEDKSREDGVKTGGKKGEEKRQSPDRTEVDKERAKATGGSDASKTADSPPLGQKGTVTPTAGNKDDAKDKGVKQGKEVEELFRAGKDKERQERSVTPDRTENEGNKKDDKMKDKEALPQKTKESTIPISKDQVNDDKRDRKGKTEDDKTKREESVRHPPTLKHSDALRQKPKESATSNVGPADDKTSRERKTENKKADGKEDVQRPQTPKYSDALRQKPKGGKIEDDKVEGKQDSQSPEIKKYSDATHQKPKEGVSNISQNDDKKSREGKSKDKMEEEVVRHPNQTPTYSSVLRQKPQENATSTVKGGDDDPKNKESDVKKHQEGDKKSAKPSSVDTGRTTQSSSPDRFNKEQIKDDTEKTEEGKGRPVSSDRTSKGKDTEDDRKKKENDVTAKQSGPVREIDKSKEKSDGKPKTEGKSYQTREDETKKYEKDKDKGKDDGKHGSTVQQKERIETPDKSRVTSEKIHDGKDSGKKEGKPGILKKPPPNSTEPVTKDENKVGSTKKVASKDSAVPSEQTRKGEKKQDKKKNEIFRTDSLELTSKRSELQANAKKKRDEELAKGAITSKDTSPTEKYDKERQKGKNEEKPFIKRHVDSSHTSPKQFSMPADQPGKDGGEEDNEKKRDEMKKSSSAKEDAKRQKDDIHDLKDTRVQTEKPTDKEGSKDSDQIYDKNLKEKLEEKLKVPLEPKREKISSAKEDEVTEKAETIVKQVPEKARGENIEQEEKIEKGKELKKLYAKPADQVKEPDRKGIEADKAEKDQSKIQTDVVKEKEKLEEKPEETLKKVTTSKDMSEIDKVRKDHMPPKSKSDQELERKEREAHEQKIVDADIAKKAQKSVIDEVSGRHQKKEEETDKLPEKISEVKKGETGQEIISEKPVEKETEDVQKQKDKSKKMGKEIIGKLITDLPKKKDKIKEAEKTTVREEEKEEPVVQEETGQKEIIVEEKTETLTKPYEEPKEALSKKPKEELLDADKQVEVVKGKKKSDDEQLPEERKISEPREDKAPKQIEVDVPEKMSSEVRELLPKETSKHPDSELPVFEERLSDKKKFDGEISTRMDVTEEDNSKADIKEKPRLTEDEEAETLPKSVEEVTEKTMVQKELKEAAIEGIPLTDSKMKLAELLETKLGEEKAELKKDGIDEKDLKQEEKYGGVEHRCAAIIRQAKERCAANAALSGGVVILPDKKQVPRENVIPQGYLPGEILPPVVSPQSTPEVLDWARTSDKQQKTCKGVCATKVKDDKNQFNVEESEASRQVRDTFETDMSIEPIIEKKTATSIGRGLTRILSGEVLGTGVLPKVVLERKKECTAPCAQKADPSKPNQVNKSTEIEPEDDKVTEKDISKDNHLEMRTLKKTVIPQSDEQDKSVIIEELKLSDDITHILEGKLEEFIDEQENKEQAEEYNLSVSEESKKMKTVDTLEISTITEPIDIPASQLDRTDKIDDSKKQSTVTPQQISVPESVVEEIIECVKETDESHDSKKVIDNETITAEEFTEVDSTLLKESLETDLTDLINTLPPLSSQVENVPLKKQQLDKENTAIVIVPIKDNSTTKDSVIPRAITLHDSKETIMQPILREEPIIIPVSDLPSQPIPEAFIPRAASLEIAKNATQTSPNVASKQIATAPMLKDQISGTDAITVREVHVAAASDNASKGTYICPPTNIIPTSAVVPTQTHPSSVTCKGTAACVTVEDKNTWVCRCKCTVITNRADREAIIISDSEQPKADIFEKIHFTPPVVCEAKCAKKKHEMAQVDFNARPCVEEKGTWVCKGKCTVLTRDAYEGETLIITDSEDPNGNIFEKIPLGHMKKKEYKICGAVDSDKTDTGAVTCPCKESARSTRGKRKICTGVCASQKRVCTSANRNNDRGICVNEEKVCDGGRKICTAICSNVGNASMAQGKRVCGPINRENIPTVRNISLEKAVPSKKYQGCIPGVTCKPLPKQNKYSCQCKCVTSNQKSYTETATDTVSPGTDLSDELPSLIIHRNAENLALKNALAVNNKR